MNVVFPNKLTRKTDFETRGIDSRTASSLGDIIWKKASSCNKTGKANYLPRCFQAKWDDHEVLKGLHHPLAHQLLACGPA